MKKSAFYMLLKTVKSLSISFERYYKKRTENGSGYTKDYLLRFIASIRPTPVSIETLPDNLSRKMPDQ